MFPLKNLARKGLIMYKINKLFLDPVCRFWIFPYEKSISQIDILSLKSFHMPSSLINMTKHVSLQECDAPNKNTVNI